MRDFRMQRRTFLAGMGTTALGTLLRPSMSYAQTGVAPQRLLLIHRPCGTALGTGHDNWWWPTGGITGWKASPLISSFTDGKIASLQNKMVVLQHLSAHRNMNWSGDKHGAGFLGMVTPAISGNAWLQSANATPASKADPNGKSITPSGPSADQLFLSQIPALKGPPGAPCPVPSVQLTASTESSDQTNDWHCLKVTSYSQTAAGGPITPLWPTASPNQAFMNYFAQSTMGMSTAQIMRANAQNKSVLDFANGGLMNLQTQVPKSQLPKVQAHLQAISQLEQMVGNSAAMSCTSPPTPAGGWLTPTIDTLSSQNPAGGSSADFGPLDQQTYPMWQQHKEIIKTMFQCDLTRVLSFTFGYGDSDIRFFNVLNAAPFTGTYLDLNGNPIQDADSDHDISENEGTDPTDAQYLIDKYYCDRTAELLAEMDATKDVDGNTLLDNTLVVFWSEVSNGNAKGAVDMPVVLFGGKFLKMNGGSFLTLSNTTQTPNQGVSRPDPPYMSDLWVTIAQAWGYNLAAFGDPSWNTGPIQGIFG
jgi:hypothetical protein